MREEKHTAIRTRFAPSPTGALHSGTVRTALFAWLLARHANGKFLLRIEDTDQKREVVGGIDNIKRSLLWLGLSWDEGPDVGGAYGPYIQSERLSIYKEVAQDMIKQGEAYADPYSPDELQRLREKSQVEKRPFLYRDYRPENPPEWDGSQPLRVKLEAKPISWDDAVMGRVDMGKEMIDDFIIIKADGYPTYNFGHIIDDHMMKISHIIRSQEFLSSIPKFIALHEVLGWQSPINVTVPPVLDESGKRKLSKRFGAKPILDYKELGYLPEAMLNFLATIGWNDGTEQEIYSVDELVKKFDLSKVQKSGGNFDEKRLTWINGVHIRQLRLSELYERSDNFWPKSASSAEKSYKLEVLGLLQERLKYLGELKDLSSYFFDEPIVQKETLTGNKQLGSLTISNAKKMLSRALDVISDEKIVYDHENLEKSLRSLIDELGTKPGVFFSLIRLTITGRDISAGLFETMQILGKDKVMRRIKRFIDSL